MRKLLMIVGAVALLGFGCAGKQEASVETRLPSPSEVRTQVSGIAQAQEALRQHAILLLQAQTQGVEASVLSAWRAEAQLASQKVQAGDYAGAVADVQALNAQIETYLQK